MSHCNASYRILRKVKRFDFVVFGVTYTIVLGKMGAGQSTTTAVETMYTATAASSIAAAQATALTLSPASNVKGKDFDRFVQIFLENQDFDIAAGDRMSRYSIFVHLKKGRHADSPAANLAALGAQGVVLDKYYSVTHPSQVGSLRHAAMYVSVG